jgi:hypothetical protein
VYVTYCPIKSLSVWKLDGRKVGTSLGQKDRFAMLKDGLVLICRESLLWRVKLAKELATSSECAGPTLSPSEAKKALTSLSTRPVVRFGSQSSKNSQPQWATWERQPGPFLRRLDGGLWESKNLTLAWRHEKDRNKHLAEHKSLGLVLHGLRGHCCVRLSRAGLSDHQISDIVGMSIPMVGRYTRLSAQKENALAAVISLSRYKSLKLKDA